MTNPMFDRDSWERRWEQALREHPDKVSSRPPNEYLLAEIGDLRPGLALDAGCGHGAETIWLAAAGWRVTAVDFSVTARPVDSPDPRGGHRRGHRLGRE